MQSAQKDIKSRLRSHSDKEKSKVEEDTILSTPETSKGNKTLHNLSSKKKEKTTSQPVVSLSPVNMTSEGKHREKKKMDLETLANMITKLTTEVQSMKTQLDDVPSKSLVTSIQT